MAEQKARIRVTSGYSGQRINAAYIPEGDYDIDDARLLGQSQFLLDSGRAVQLDAKGYPTVITVTEGQTDRDLSGKPIVVPVGQDQGHVSNVVAPVYAQFPNNASASEVIQPYEIGTTEPAAAAGSEHKLNGTVSAKTEAEARQEQAVTETAVTEAEAARAHAAATDGEGDDSADGDELEDDEPTADEPYADMKLDALRAEVNRREVKPLDDDGNEVAVSKAKRAWLVEALRQSEPKAE